MTLPRRHAGATLSAHYLALVCRDLMQRGHAEARVLEGTGLSLAQLDEPMRQVPLATGSLVFLNACRLSGDPGLGLAIGRQLNLRSHGFLGYAILSSRSIGEALDLCIRYFRTRTSLLEIRLFREDDAAVVQLDEGLPLGPLGPLLLDAVMTLMLVCGRQVTGRDFHGELRLAMPRQPHHDQWPEAARATLRFDCPFNQIRFPRIGLQLPIGTPDPQLQQMALAQCEEELQRLHDSGGLLAEVRQLIKRHLAEDASVERIASELGMSARTLRRRLDELGTSYQMILEQLRRGRAVELLLHTPDGIDAIAADLGYEDPSNFSRAFKRWTGLSPRAYRQSRGG